MDLKSKRVASRIAFLVEHFIPHAPARTIVDITQTVTLENFRPAGSEPNMTSLIQSIERAAKDSPSAQVCIDVLSSLCARNMDVGKKVALLLLELKRQPIPAHMNIRQARGNLEIMADERQVQIQRDFLYQLQSGRAGHYLRLDGDSVREVLSDFEIKCLRAALDTGEKAHFIVDYSRNVLSKAQAYRGVCSQRFAHALLDELDLYYRFLSLMESELQESVGGEDKPVHLTQLYVWTHKPHARLKYLQAMCETCDGASGGYLCSLLYSFSLSGSPFEKEIAERVLLKTYQPLKHMCQDYIQYGTVPRLPPPPPNESDEYRNILRGEFFIFQEPPSGTSTEAAIWSQQQPHERLAMNPAMIPTFVGTELAKRIHRLGQEACVATQLELVLVPDEEHNDNDDGNNDDDDDSGTPRDNGRAHHSGSEGVSPKLHMASFVLLMERKINRSLIHSFFHEHRLLAHLVNLKQVFLLGQGDLFQFLLEGSRHFVSPTKLELEFLLENAMEQSNSRHLPLLSQTLSIVESETEDAQNFGFKYELGFPLEGSFLLDLSEYRFCFKFLWKLKRWEFKLKQIWSEYRKHNMVASQVLFLSHHMLHFIITLLHYESFEVIEGNWRRFMKKLYRQETSDEEVHRIRQNLRRQQKGTPQDDRHVINVQGVVELKQLHDDYLKSIQNEGFMFTSATDKSTPLDAVFRIIAQFHGLCKRFQGHVTMDERERRSTFSEATNGLLETTAAGEQLFSFLEEVQGLTDKYRRAMMNLLEDWYHSENTNLVFLSRRVDFNQFYHIQE